MGFDLDRIGIGIVLVMFVVIKRQCVQKTGNTNLQAKRALWLEHSSLGN